MSNQRYRHTQTGWIIIGVMIVVVAILLPAVAGIGGGKPPVAVVILILLLTALFSTLTVVVDDTYLSVNFTLGLIRKRIALRDIRHYRPVGNPWYYGWGIHLYPGGVLYNVSGSQAVEILLKGGRRLRVGTDEPGPLCRAIELVIGPPKPLSPAEQAQVSSSTGKWWIAAAGILVLVLGGIGLLAYVEERPPKAWVTGESFRVEGVVYSADFPVSAITAVSLCEHIPGILARTNGYAGGRTLRGHFRLTQLGDGQLFVRLGYPPYLLVRSRTDYVIVNFRDPARTRNLYAELLRTWRGEAEDCPIR